MKKKKNYCSLIWITATGALFKISSELHAKAYLPYVYFNQTK